MSASERRKAAAGDHDLPVVAHRRDGQPWRATLPLVDLLELLAWRERA